MHKTRDACAGNEEGLDTEDSVPRRTSLVGQALVPSPSAGPTADLSQERSFCNPEDTEKAVATGRQVSSQASNAYKQLVVTVLVSSVLSDL